MANISDGNYTGLVDSVQAWLHRSDIADPDVDNFIHLFEADFNSRLRARNMDTQTTIGVTSGYLPHPTDWLEWRSIYRVQGTFREPLTPVSNEAGAVDYGYSYLSDPRGYRVVGDKTFVEPANGSGAWTYETIYSIKVPELSSTQTTNWLLTRFPHVYLQGCMFWASDFLVDDQKQQKYSALMDRTLDQIKIESDKAKYSGGVPTMRPDRWY